jgi:predicted RNA-binding protein Jag
MQVEKLLTDIFGLEVNPQEAALQEAAEAIGLVRTSGHSQQLTPQNAYIRRLQHQLAERESLMSRSRGHEPQRRVEVLAP